MRTAIRKRLDALLEDRFDADFPMFKRLQIPKNEPSIWAACQTPKSLTFFIVIYPIKKEDSFAVEIAWSENGKFPWDSIGYELDLTSQSWRGRVGQVLIPPRDSIWELDPEYKRAGMRWLEAIERGKVTAEPTNGLVSDICQNLPPIIDDVVKTIKNHAIPLFFAIQKLRGHEVIA